MNYESGVSMQVGASVVFISHSESAYIWHGGLSRPLVKTSLPA